MSNSTSFTEAPIYIYNSQYREGDLYASHPECVQENMARLKEFSVNPQRIQLIADPSSLERALKTNPKGILILVGGYTPFLTKELESVYTKITEAVRKGSLNVWGQCAGANTICQEFSHSSKPSFNRPAIKQLKLLPYVADTKVYPLEKKNGPEDLVNRKIIQLQSDKNEKFASLWYRGSQFRLIPQVQSELALTTLAYYADLNEREPPIASMCGINKQGAAIVASGAHPEVVEADVLSCHKAAREKLGADKARQEHLKTIFEILGILQKKSQPNLLRSIWLPQPIAYIELNKKNKGQSIQLTRSTTTITANRGARIERIPRFTGEKDPTMYRHRAVEHQTRNLSHPPILGNTALPSGCRSGRDVNLLHRIASHLLKLNKFKR